MASTAAQAAVVTSDLGFATTLATDNAAADAAAWLAQKGSPWINPATNLLQTHLSSASYLSGGGSNTQTQLDYFHDGLLVSGTDVNDTPSNLSLFTASAEMKFVFDTPFDLARIDTFTNYQGNSRTGQAYRVFTSTNGGSSWNLLYTVDYGNVATGSNAIRGVSATIETGTANTTGINAILFDVNNFTGSSNNSAYAEIAIYAVPEASTVWLLGAGAVLVLLGGARRWKASRSASC